MSLDEQPGFFAQPMNRMIAIGVAVVIVIAAGVGTYFMLGHGHGGASSSSASKAIDSGDPMLVDAANVAAAAEKGGICERTLQSYAIVPDAASLNGSETATQTEGRFTCLASSNGQTFTLTVDKVCDDISDTHCLMLQRVTDASGGALFARQP
jgi:hypothetical protein